MEDEKKVSFYAIGREFVNQFRVGDGVEGTPKVNVSYGGVPVVVDGESPVVEGFKKVSCCGVFFEKAMLMR